MSKPQILIDIDNIEANVESILNSSISTHNQSNSIASLPIGTVDGIVDDVKVDGMTLVNSVKNGDFSDGTVGWTSINVIATPLSNEVSILASVNNSQFRQLVPSYIENGSVYFMSADVKANSNLVGMGNWSNTIKYHSGSGKYEKLSGTITTALNSAFSFQDKRSSGWDNYYIKNATLINLTALFGAGNEPTLAQMDSMVERYIDGMQSVDDTEIQTVGKNLFDKSNATLGKDLYYVDNSIMISPTQGHSDYIKISSGKNYYLHGTSSPIRVLYYDSNKNFISGQAGTNPYGVLTIPLNAVYCRTGFSLTHIDIVQLEQGTSATPYTPYQSSALSITPTLKRLPNGVKDRVYESNGELWLEKNVEEYTLVASDITYSSLVNVDEVTIPKNINYLNYNITGTAVFKDTLFNGGYNPLYYQYNSRDNIAYINTWNSMISATKYIIILPKGTYATLELAQTALTGTKIQYQLATPQLINLTEMGLTDGELMSFKDGSCIINSSIIPTISMSVPTNRSSQIDSLLESANSQAKQIESKADDVDLVAHKADITSHNDIREQINSLVSQFCRITKTVSQSIAHSVTTVLTFDSEVFDEDNMFEIASNTKIYCKKSGIYAIFGKITYDINATSVRALYLRLNGTTNILIDNKLASPSGSYTHITASTLYKLNVGDYLEILAYQYSGSAVNVTASDFSIAKVG